MKLLKIIIFAAVLNLVCTSPAEAYRTIRSIALELNTTNDDKDNNTYLECQILTSDNHWLAQNSGQFGLFPDNSFYTLYLNLGNANYSETLLSQSSIFLRIVPDGDDTWNFNWCVIVTYTDGSQSRSCGRGGLNEGANWFRLTLFS